MTAIGMSHLQAGILIVDVTILAVVALLAFLMGLHR